MALRARLQRVARGARHVAQEVSEATGLSFGHLGGFERDFHHLLGRKSQVAHHADGLRQAEEASMKVHQARRAPF